MNCHRGTVLILIVGVISLGVGMQWTELAHLLTQMVAPAKTPLR